MKHSSAVLFALMFFVISTISSSFAQLPWTKDVNNPVFTGTAGDWDAQGVWVPSVLFHNNMYHMWYSSSDFSGIGHATSIDGINWQKDVNNPVLVKGTPNSWEDEDVSAPMVVVVNDTFHMWYTGHSQPEDYLGYLIGHATSLDGSIWVRDALNPVLDKGNPGTWDDTWVYSGSVVFDGLYYHMWYGAWDGAQPDTVRTGHAISLIPNGRNWERDPANPVLVPTESWERDRLEAPNVFFDGSKFHMWYSAGPYFNNQHIGYATSQDGSTWSRYSNNPVLSPGSSGTWDDAAIYYVSVIQLNSSFKMWYTGYDGVKEQIGLATAPVTLNVPGDYSTIQAAIDAAVDGNLVLVADGTYQENINFKGKAITVASHYYIDGDTSHISNTVIDGSNPSNPDSGSVVFFISGEDTTSVISGFTITRGTGTKTQNWYEGQLILSREGGGVFCYDAGARISHNKITDNNIPQYVQSGGGGVAGLSVNRTDHVIIEDNQIINNRITGMDQSYGSAITLNFNGTIINNHISHNISNATDLAFGAVSCWSEADSLRSILIQENYIGNNKSTANNAYAGGIDIELGMSGLILGNEIIDDTLSASNEAQGGGIWMYQVVEEVIINRNRISNNMASGGLGGVGGGIALSSGGTNGNVSIVNNIISGNFCAGRGGGIGSYEGSPQIINNTIVNNSAGSVGGGGISEIGGNPPRIVNTIVWGNQSTSNPQISGTPTVRYSDIQGGYAGEGNIDADPLFVPDDSLFHLSDNSLCVNTGADSIQIDALWYRPPSDDYEGDDRPYMGIQPDMGADETQVSPVGIEPQPTAGIPKSYALEQNFPNPFNPTTNIEFSIPKSEFVTLKIYNILGEEVATLVSERLTSGKYKYDWDASDLASGLYLYRIQTGSYVEAKKMLLIR
jgi:predicted GH43/DUF377 family glycosyl hydrolase